MDGSLHKTLAIPPLNEPYAYLNPTILATFHCLETRDIHYISGDIEIHINFEAPINFTEIMCFYKMSAKWLSAPWDVGSLDVG